MTSSRVIQEDFVREVAFKLNVDGQKEFCQFGMGSDHTGEDEKHN